MAWSVLTSQRLFLEKAATSIFSGAVPRFSALHYFSLERPLPCHFFRSAPLRELYSPKHHLNCHFWTGWTHNMPPHSCTLLLASNNAESETGFSIWSEKARLFKCKFTPRGAVSFLTHRGVETHQRHRCRSFGITDYELMKWERSTLPRWLFDCIFQHIIFLFDSGWKQK